jgi:threonine/homoserine/homoserine lactone efflux protein
VAVGIGTIVQRSAPVFTVLKIAGAAYIFVLGLRAIRDRRALSEVFDATRYSRQPGSSVSTTQ